MISELYRRIVTALSAVDFGNVPIVPRGSERAIPPIGDSYQITPADVRKAVATWNRLMPKKYRGILDARREEPK